MRVINPSEPDILTAGERYTLDTKLKKLLNDEDCCIYVQPIVNGMKPDFMVIGKNFGIIIIEVKDWDDDYILSANNSIVTCTDKKYKSPVSQINTYSHIINSKLNNLYDLIDDKGELTVHVTSMIFYVNLTNESLLKYPSLVDDSVFVFDKRDLRQLSKEQLFTNISSPFSEQELLAIRGVLFPEIIVPHENCINNDELQGITDIRTLDFEQEEFSKKVPNGHYMVSGIPGSGKTIILLSRALHLAQSNHQCKIIILTYTKALANKLIHQLNVKAKEMNIPDSILENIKVNNFHKLCYDLAGSPEYFKPKKDESYYSEFWPQEAVKAVKNNPIYDAVLVDEYQDFHANWFELCREVCKKNSNGEENLFFAGDRLQRIYNVTWSSYKEIGINIQGRSKLLKTPYRTNQNHLDFSLKFLSKNESLAKDINNFYEIGKLNAYSSSNENIELSIGNTATFLKNIEHLIIDLNVSPEDILILCHKNYECTEIMRILPTSIKDDFVSGKEPKNGKGLVTTYHSSKGLEAKYCVLFKVEGFEMDQKNRSLVYVGMTRASEKLIINYERNKNFAEEITEMLSA